MGINMAILQTVEGGPQLRMSDIETLERRLGISLPRTYRDFLVRGNGGRPERDLFAVLGCTANPVARIHLFFGINDPIDSCNVTWNVEVLRERLPKELIPIATTEGADKICLASDTGAIVYWDGYSNELFPVARSFDAFVDSLFRDDLSPSLEPEAES